MSSAAITLPESASYHKTTAARHRGFRSFGKTRSRPIQQTRRRGDRRQGPHSGQNPQEPARAHPADRGQQGRSGETDAVHRRGAALIRPRCQGEDAMEICRKRGYCVVVGVRRWTTALAAANCLDRIAAVPHFHWARAVVNAGSSARRHPSRIPSGLIPLPATTRPSPEIAVASSSDHPVASMSR